MRKIMTVMMVCAAMLGVSALPGHAATASVSGSYTGTEHWQADALCGSLRSFTDAEGTIAPFGAATLTLQLCIGTSTNFATIVSGSFTLTAGGGSLSGHVTSGTLTFRPPFAAFTVEVTIDSGTGDFVGATGTLTVDGTANAGFGPPDIDVPASGDIVGQVTRGSASSSSRRNRHPGDDPARFPRARTAVPRLSRRYLRERGDVSPAPWSFTRTVDLGVYVG
jgi:hypothetical protein